jgi:hypothetical protein
MQSLLKTDVWISRYEINKFKQQSEILKRKRNGLNPVLTLGAILFAGTASRGSLSWTARSYDQPTDLIAQYRFAK